MLIEGVREDSSTLRKEINETQIRFLTYLLSIIRFLYQVRIRWRKSFLAKVNPMSFEFTSSGVRFPTMTYKLFQTRIVDSDKMLSESRRSTKTFGAQ